MRRLPAAQLDQASLRLIVSGGHDALNVLLDGARQIALVLIDRARFIGVSSGILERGSTQMDQPQRVIELKVIPENGSRFEITLRRSGRKLRQLVPVGRGFGVLFAIGIDLANAGDGLVVGSVAPCSIGRECDRALKGARNGIGQRAMYRDG